MFQHSFPQIWDLFLHAAIPKKEREKVEKSRSSHSTVWHSASISIFITFLLLLSLPKTHRMINILYEEKFNLTDIKSCGSEKLFFCHNVTFVKSAAERREKKRKEVEMTKLKHWKLLTFSPRVFPFSQSQLGWVTRKMRHSNFKAFYHDWKSTRIYLGCSNRFERESEKASVCGFSFFDISHFSFSHSNNELEFQHRILRILWISRDILFSNSNEIWEIRCFVLIISFDFIHCSWSFTHRKTHSNKFKFLIYSNVNCFCVFLQKFYYSWWSCLNEDNVHRKGARGETRWYE